MAGEGKLCYKPNDGRLAFKRGGDGSLVFKSSGKPSDIQIAIAAEQTQIGPIKSCGNFHDVMITPTGSFTSGRGSFTAAQGVAGSITCTATVTSAPATLVVTCSTYVGCAYPEEDPGMGFGVSVTQKGTNGFSTSKSVGNVSEESGSNTFSFTVTIGSDGKVTRVS